jgi:hypothetical protein
MKSALSNKPLVWHLQFVIYEIQLSSIWFAVLAADELNSTRIKNDISLFKVFFV